MMNESHAWSGALLAFSAVDVATVAGLVSWHPLGAAYFAVITAGAAVAPDMDQPGSAPSRSFGPVSWQLARFLGWLGAREQARTRTPLDYRDEDGHRTITHSWPAWLSMGLVIGTVCTVVGDRAVVFTGYVFCALALRSLLGRSGAAEGLARVLRFLASLVSEVAKLLPVMTRPILRGLTRLLRFLARTARGWEWLCTNLAAAALAVAGSALAPTGGLGALGPLLGVAVTVGMGCHSLGDCPSALGCPLLAPIKIAGRRWYRVRLTFGRKKGFAVGQKFEKTKLFPAIVSATVIAAAGTVPVVRATAGEVLAGWWAAVPQVVVLLVLAAVALVVVMVLALRRRRVGLAAREASAPTPTARPGRGGRTSARRGRI